MAVDPVIVRESRDVTPVPDSVAVEVNERLDDTQMLESGEASVDSQATPQVEEGETEDEKVETEKMEGEATPAVPSTDDIDSTTQNANATAEVMDTT